jgi:hypothetical protein
MLDWKSIGPFDEEARVGCKSMLFLEKCPTLADLRALNVQ